MIAWSIKAGENNWKMALSFHSGAFSFHVLSDQQFKTLKQQYIEV